MDQTLSSSGPVWSAGQHLEWDEAVITSVATTNRTTNEQLPDYRAYPDFFVGPVGLLEIWRSAIKWRITNRFILPSDEASSVIYTTN